VVGVSEFFDYVESLVIKLKWVKWHIREKLRTFSPEELECFVLDGLIEPEEVPEGLRTNWVKWRVSMTRLAQSGGDDSSAGQNKREVRP
jgi:hypothetical protein